MPEHLKFDTDFLDKKWPTETDENNDLVEEDADLETDSNWKIILAIVIGGILFVGGLNFILSRNSLKSTNTESYTQSSVNQVSPEDDTIVVGDYRCSEYHYNQAVALVPDESEQEIEIARRDLENRENELDRLKSEIDSFDINESSSQHQIDQYNAMVNKYNSKLTSYKRDVTSFNSRVDKYNSQIKAYNDYLKSNCVPDR